ncbi:hypothetical protein E2C01_063036 [Portunus trituberculatus]|uniref:Uncharacterized protein n=1 Tax=Portunus trituberculatus TaxID=210409 RepID=A0A5B7HFT9_PORTR|nr:hypothetical protein [Portunus trituberculatus]
MHYSFIKVRWRRICIVSVPCSVISSLFQATYAS